MVVHRPRRHSLHRWVRGPEPQRRRDRNLDDIELIGDDGIELIGAKIAPPPPPPPRPLASTQLVKRWPPVQKGSFDPSTLVDAVGARIGSSADEPMGWELFIGIRVAEEGMLHRSGIKVIYHIGSSHYATTIPGELMICTSERYEVDGRCPFDKT
jgi:hypothetical protein